MRDKVKIENVEMKVIKWERVWNDEREREREREMKPIPTMSFFFWERLLLWVECYNISLGTIFFKKNEIKHIFMKLFKWVTNLNK